MIAAWRKWEGLSQGDLGQRCPKPLAANTVSAYEIGPSSLTVRTLVNVLRGLKVPGTSDVERLERFFAGPSDDSIHEDAARVAAAAADLHARLKRRRGGTRE